MKRISSKSTAWIKRGFPTLWFGFLTFFFVVTLVHAVAYGEYKDLLGYLFMLMIVICLAIFGYFIMRSLAWDLADEVFDMGEYLLVKKSSLEECIYLKDIVNVNVSIFTNPPRITLRLRQQSLLGNEVSFSPAKTSSVFFASPFSKNPLAEDLINRIEQTRS